MTVASPPPPPGAPAPKKGMGPLGWIAIGCGAIAVLGILALAVGGYMFKKKIVDPIQENPTMAAAEMIVKLNPELELVSSDPDKNTLTIREKSTGKVVTISAEDIEQGKITFETAEGKTVVDASSSGESGSVRVTGPEGAEVTWGGEAPKDLPSWVPIYPGSEVQAALDATNAEGRTVSFTAATEDGIDEVIPYYEQSLRDAGLTVNKTTMETNGEPSAILAGNSEDNTKTVTVMIGQQDGKTMATINFNAKN